MELLSKVVPLAMLAFVVSSMLAVGVSLTVRQIMAPLRNGKLVSLALLANFVLMPLGALLIARLLRLDEPLGIALLLLGTAAGAPFLPKLAGLAKSDLAFAVGLMVLLMVLTVGYMPVVLPLLLEGVSVDPAKIARSLVLLMLLPLGAGLLPKRRRRNPRQIHLPAGELGFFVAKPFHGRTHGRQRCHSRDFVPHDRDWPGCGRTRGGAHGQSHITTKQRKISLT